MIRPWWPFFVLESTQKTEGPKKGEVLSEVFFLYSEGDSFNSPSTHTSVFSHLVIINVTCEFTDRCFDIFPHSYNTVINVVIFIYLWIIIRFLTSGTSSRLFDLYQQDTQGSGDAYNFRFREYFLPCQGIFFTSSGSIFYRVINVYWIRIREYIKFIRDVMNIIDYVIFTIRLQK